MNNPTPPAAASVPDDVYSLTIEAMAEIVTLTEPQWVHDQLPREFSDGLLNRQSVMMILTRLKTRLDAARIQSAQPSGVAEKWIEVLKLLRVALPEVGLNGWTSGVAALDWAIPILSAPPIAQQGGVEVTYDRELIHDMLGKYADLIETPGVDQSGQYHTSSIDEQMQLLEAADHHEAHTKAALASKADGGES